MKPPTRYRRALLCLLALMPVLASAATLRVRPGERIGDAIAQAGAGDVIEIERGVYHESLRIEKPLTLRGIGKPTLDGGGEGDVIRVVAPDVTIEGLIVRDSGDDLGQQHAGIYIQPGAHRAQVRGCDFAHVLFGLWIEKANDVKVEDNLITGMREKFSSQRGNGIQLYNTQGARIARNHISFTRDGIYVDVSHHAEFVGNRIHDVRYGSHYMNSYHNLWENNASYNNVGGLALMEVRDITARGNRTWNNTDHGIMLRTLQDSVIENNVAANNARGFFIYDVSYSTLRGNLLVGNQVGIHLWAGSYDNAVDGNDFVLNGEQVRYVASRDVEWGKRAGNYWSNYLGWDQDGDGRGDTPYEASDVGDRLVSRYPFVKLLDSSPALQTLKLISRQFPVLRVPTILDAAPAMQPHHADWRRWLSSPESGDPP